jgi:flagellar biosynthetic protein FliR
VSDAALLQALPGWAFALGLVLARAGTAVMLLPGFGESELPATVRAGFALALTLLLLPVLAPRLPGIPEAPAAALLLIAGEVLAGATLGFMARLAALALPAAGQILSTMIGLANVLQPDPVLGAQATPVSRLFSLAVPLLVLTTGLHGLALTALVGSYTAWPPGEVPDGSAGAVVASVSAFLVLAVRLAAPFLIAGLLWQGALGLLARLVPQSQVFTLAMPGQILGGLALLGILGTGLLRLWESGLREALALLPGS